MNNILLMEHFQLILNHKMKVGNYKFKTFSFN